MIVKVSAYIMIVKLTVEVSWTMFLVSEYMSGIIVEYETQVHADLSCYELNCAGYLWHAIRFL